ncbi:hypothetical protein Tco_0607141 [Tanacetum coccineum]
MASFTITRVFQYGTLSFLKPRDGISSEWSSASKRLLWKGNVPTWSFQISKLSPRLSVPLPDVSMSVVFVRIARIVKTLRSGYQQKDRKPSQNDKTEHGMEKTVQNQGQSPKMSKSESITERNHHKPEPELKNTIECNLYPSDGPGKPNSIFMKTVKTKWALNQFQQPICVQLTKTVKTLKTKS